MFSFGREDTHKEQLVELGHMLNPKLKKQLIRQQQRIKNSLKKNAEPTDNENNEPEPENEPKMEIAQNEQTIGTEKTKENAKPMDSEIHAAEPEAEAEGKQPQPDADLENQVDTFVDQAEAGSELDLQGVGSMDLGQRVKGGGGAGTEEENSADEIRAASHDGVGVKQPYGPQTAQQTAQTAKYDKLLGVEQKIGTGKSSKVIVTSLHFHIFERLCVCTIRVGIVCPPREV